MENLEFVENPVEKNFEFVEKATENKIEEKRVWARMKFF